LGDQAPTKKAIEKNPTNVLKVYRQILQYNKAYEEKKTPGNTEFHQRKRQKKKKKRLQKRGLRLYKRCFNKIEKEHPTLSKEEVHNVMEGIYDEVYSGNNSIVIQYRDLVKNQVTTQGAGVMDTHLAKVLKVYQKRLSKWKEKDQRRRLKQIAEKTPEEKESDEKVVKKTPKTVPENKGMRLFTLLPVKSSNTMSNILIDKRAMQDLILGDKERKIGEAHAGLYKTVKTLIKEDPMSVIKLFFDIERFETITKKFVHFLTNGVSVSVLLGKESEPKSRARKPKRKREEEDELPALSSPSYETRVGLDPGLHYLFVAKNNSNAEDKKLSAKMSSKEYYHESKFNWNVSKQKKCYARCPWWKEMINGNITSED
jgi:hypothetical protein